MGQVRTTIGQGAFMGWTNMEGQTLQHFLKGKTSLLLFSLSLYEFILFHRLFIFLNVLQERGWQDPKKWQQLHKN